MLQNPPTFRNVFDDLLLFVGIEVANNAPLYIRERLINDINAAVQLMQVAGADFMARQVTGASAIANNSTISLTDAVQHVYGVWNASDGTQLHECATRGEAKLWGLVNLGTATPANGKPLAYYLQRTWNNSGSTPGDSITMSMILLPTPDVNYSLTMDTGITAPFYGYADLLAGSAYTTIDVSSFTADLTSGSYIALFTANESEVDVYFNVNGATPPVSYPNIDVELTSEDTPATCAQKLALAISQSESFTATYSGNVVGISTDTAGAINPATDNGTGFTVTEVRRGSAPTVIAVPHAYIASILLPIARYNVSTATWFYKPAALPSVQADYKRALALLGISDPSFIPDRDNAKREKAQGPVPLATPRPPTDEEAA